MKLSLSEKLAKAAAAEPEDFDPEDHESKNFSANSSDEDEEFSDEDKTSHYIDVGQSKLRDDGIALTEGKYKGQKLSRKDLSQDISDSNSDISEEDSEEENDNNTENSKPKTQISQILNEEQKQLLQQLSSTQNSDANKGKAVFAQYKIYENLLDLRIQVQKILQKTNTNDTQANIPSLISALLEMRSQIAISPNTQTSGKSGKSDQSELSDLNASCNQMDVDLSRARDDILAKWSRKVELSSGRNALNKFNKLSQSTDQQVRNVLADMPRLVARTQVNRQNFESKTPESIFDDSDFYKMLLKDLVDRRMADSSVAEGLKWQTKVTKQKRKVDVKASKGRRLRYDVNEKIQGFDAPRNVYKWSDTQAEDLYAGLLGVQITMDDNEANEEIKADDGFTIFG